MVDCSIGTPCDPPLARRARGAGVVGHRARLPRLGRAARSCARPPRRWLARRFGLADVPAVVGRRLRGDQGARRLGAARAPAAPARTGHGALPGGVLSDLRHGRRAGRAAAPSPSRPPPGRLGGLDLDAIDPADAGRALRAVVELAVEPDRRAGRPRRGGGLGTGARRPGVLRRVLRRVHLGRPAPSVLQHGPDGVVAVHSLSKRSNLAGVRVGLLRRGRRARRVPAGRAPARRPHGPGPGAGRRGGRPGRRRPRGGPAGALPGAAGLPGRRPRRATAARSASPRAASTCGSRCPPDRWPDAWAMAEALATDGGLLVSPGDLYGEAAPGTCGWRVVQPMERLALVGERLARVRHG